MRIIINGLKISDDLSEKEVFKLKQVNKLLEELLGVSLKTFLNDRNWNIDLNFVKSVITGKVSDDASQHIFDSVHGMHVIKDSRTYSEFLRNLFLGWIVEDATVEKLVSLGFNADLFEDRFSKRMIKRRVISLPDLIIPETNTHIEVIQTYMSEFRRKSIVRFRGSKYKKLKEFNSHIILFDLSQDDIYFSFFNINDDVEKAWMGNVYPSKTGYFVKLSNANYYNVKMFDDVVVEKIKTCKIK